MAYRTEHIKVRLSPQEKKTALSKAKESDVSLSSYVRKSILGESILSKSDAQMVLEIKKIGVNINQIAKHVNFLPVDDFVLSAIKRVDNYIGELKNITDQLK